MKIRATLLLLSLLAAQAASAQDVTRAISHVDGGLYRFNNASHASVFYVWDEGVVVTDPISAGDAAWLNAEIGKLTDKPISHLVFSHSHGDHVSGGSAFGDVPVVIAHANAPAEIDGVAPTQRFDDTLEVDLGDSSVELTYLGPGHGEDLIAMVFRPENVAFVVDAVAVRRLPYRDFPGTDVSKLLEQIDTLESLDFEILVGGHGPVGSADAVAEHRAYIEMLRDAVLEGLRSGRTVAELKADLEFDDQRNWLNYDQWRGLNIEGMARYLQESGALD